LERKDLLAGVAKLLSDDIVELKDDNFDVIAEVKPESLLKVMRKLKEDSELDFSYLMCLSGADYPPDKLEVVYHLYSMEKKHRICIKTSLKRDEPSVPSVTSLWKAAEWHERETYDFFGIKFEGNPDLRRILLPEDFAGYPLKKDFESPEVVKSPDSKEMMQPAKKS